MIDLRSIQLPVLMATAHELAAHDELLVQLDKASNGRTLFRQTSRNRCGIIAGFAQQRGKSSGADSHASKSAAAGG